MYIKLLMNYENYTEDYFTLQSNKLFKSIKYLCSTCVIPTFILTRQFPMEYISLISRLSHKSRDAVNTRDTDE